MPAPRFNLQVPRARLCKPGRFQYAGPGAPLFLGATRQTARIMEGGIYLFQRFADRRLIRNARDAPRRPAHAVLKLDSTSATVRKTAPITLDLNGIAKGYGVDRLAETLHGFGISSGLVGVDGGCGRWACAPMASPGPLPSKRPIPAAARRSRCWPCRTQPSPASVTVVARSCAEADAWATALMVLV